MNLRMLPLLASCRQMLSRDTSEVAVLFEVFGSIPMKVAIAVFASCAGGDVPTFTTTEKSEKLIAETGGRSLFMKQETVPLLPGGGVEQIEGIPELWLSETNVVPAGSGSLTEMLLVGFGPMLVTLMV